MATDVEHGEVVLGGILRGSRDLLDLALRRLTQAHFSDPVQANLFILAERYYDATGAVLSKAACVDMVSRAGADPGRVMLYEATFDACLAKRPGDDAVRWSVEQLRDLAAEKATRAALGDALMVIDRGREEKGVLVKGHDVARREVLEAFSKIERDLTIQDAPEGDIRDDGSEILSGYANAKRARLTGTSAAVKFGIDSLDLRTGGTHPGELVLVAGFAGEGKTTLSSQLAWHAAVKDGRNVFIATSETVREQVRRKLVARHSREPQFGLVDGLDTAALRDGTLTDDEEASFRDVVADLTGNPAYGRLYIAQVPRGATIGTVEAKLQRVGGLWKVDLCVIDYLALLRSDRRRQERRDELSEVLRDCKVMATTFDDGNGVPVVSPWQVNRAGYEEAVKSGFYSLRHMSETAEAEKSADIIITLLRPGDQPDGRRCELRAQLLKNRDGSTLSSLALDCDYATGTLTEKRRVSADYLT